MNNAGFTNLAVEALLLSLSGPAVLAATLVGLVVSLLQAMTQIQEQALSFAAKLIFVTLALVATATWFEALGKYTAQMFGRISSI